MQTVLMVLLFFVNLGVTAKLFVEVMSEDTD